MSQHGSGFAKSHVRTLAGRCERWFAFTHRSIGSSLVNWLVISSHSKHVITRPVQQKPPASITSWVKIPSCQPRIHRPLLFFRIDGTPPIRDHLRLKCHQPMQISQRWIKIRAWHYKILHTELWTPLPFPALAGWLSLCGSFSDSVTSWAFTNGWLGISPT